MTFTNDSVPSLDMDYRLVSCTEESYSHVAGCPHIAMADTDSYNLSLLPEEMLRFVLESSRNLLRAPRLGQILSRGRPPIHTPHYIAASSRGVVPHLSQDVFQKHTDISAVYMGLEDCMFSH